MLITYKTQNSKMHVEPNEGVLNEQLFFLRGKFKISILVCMDA